ncbi:MAG: ClbS/DfsB family four-helix bundle protein [Parachlamydiales bacterium]|nr:ClbS/DfsB family four-helix bundle protein [Parachlamydiales bacterium]
MSLKDDLQRAYDRLVKLVNSATNRKEKILEWNGGLISAADLMAYQIGWGRCLIRWYEAGIKGEEPEMPGEGFVKWDYPAIALHFYQRYRFDSGELQLSEFKQVVNRILEIIHVEEKLGNLDTIGIWDWCTLPSGKIWPLSKWIQVNTVAPYKRAAAILKRKRCPTQKSSI